MRALIVDHDPIALALLENILEANGFEVDTAQNGKEAIEKLRTGGARLMITDWEMPEMNGLELCHAVRTGDFDGYIYIIMITAKDQPQQKLTGLNAGADNFLPKPVNPAELHVCLKAARRILALETRDLAMFAMAKLAESRDPETGSHIERMQSYVRLLAQDLSNSAKYRGMIDAEYLSLIYQTSPLHDIGKVGIPDPVLLKPGKLTDEELAIMRTHTQLGAQTLEAALQRFPGARFLEIARDIAATHHEWYDGTGYPRNLAGEQIPLCGRIVALADVYDALTTRRVYKEPISHEEAKAIILAESGTHFDPDVVNAFVRMESEFVAVKNRLSDINPPKITGSAGPQTIRAVLGTLQETGILVVEDDPSQREFLTSILSMAGHQVVAASNAEDAYRLFVANSPRVVICDWSLPGASGLDLCRSLRALTVQRYTQFIMITVYSEIDKLLEAYEAGADDFLRKPVNSGELIARIRAGLRIVQLHDDLAAKSRDINEVNRRLLSLNQALEKRTITDNAA